jgi:hypothetical protein
MLTEGKGSVANVDCGGKIRHLGKVGGRWRRILGRGTLIDPSHHPAIRECVCPLPQGLGTTCLAPYHVRVVLAPRIVPCVALVPFAPAG